MSSADRLETIEEGQRSGVIQDALIPYVRDRKGELVARMIAMYRSKDTDHDKVVGLMGELAALDNLIQDLEYKRRQGYIAQEKEHA